jgi:hypothetical protein
VRQREKDKDTTVNDNYSFVELYTYQKLPRRFSSRMNESDCPSTRGDGSRVHKETITKT